MADLMMMPKLGFDMAEGVLVRWAKSEGDLVEKGELLAEIETDKATVEVESSFSGTIRQQLVTEGAIVPVGEPIAVIANAEEDVNLDDLLTASGLEAPAEPAPVEPVTPDTPPSTTTPAVAPGESADINLPGGVKASPLARRIAEENQVELLDVKGTGSGGRITKRDVQAYLDAGPVGKPLATAAASPALVRPLEPRDDEAVPLTRLRQAIGRRMTESKQNLPHFYVTHEFNMGPAMALRKDINVTLEEEGIKVSVNDFILRAVALSLHEFPNLNAYLSGNQVVQHGHINVGVAVAVEGGLLTVVCHDADFKSLSQISIEIREKAGRARAGKVRPDDIEGSTFTISNLGMFEVEDFLAIINPPEAAILAVGSVRELPVVENGEIKIGLRMKATISVDHRVSDGAEAARYLQSLAKYLEEPIRLMV
jgi:pyruvate dehydrogenase E2 component (dihydrolipoamide acetyltransferase)